MEYGKVKNNLIDMRELGASRDYSVEELVEQLLYYKANSLMEDISLLKNGQSKNTFVFDNMALKRLTRGLGMGRKLLTGKLDYVFVISGDHVIHMETTFKPLKDTIGSFAQTEVVEKSDNVDLDSLNSLCGTLLEVKMLNNTLSPISVQEYMEQLNSEAQTESPSFGR